MQRCVFILLMKMYPWLTLWHWAHVALKAVSTTNILLHCYSLSNVIVVNENVSFHQFLLCCHTSGNIVFITQSATKWAYFQLASMIFSKSSLFKYAIYSALHTRINSMLKEMNEGENDAGMLKISHDNVPRQILFIRWLWWCHEADAFFMKWFWWWHGTDILHEVIVMMKWGRCSSWIDCNDVMRQMFYMKYLWWRHEVDALHEVIVMMTWSKCSLWSDCDGKMSQMFFMQYMCWRHEADVLHEVSLMTTWGRCSSLSNCDDNTKPMFFMK